MVGLTPEGKVLDACKRMLKGLEIMGHVAYWNRMEVGIHYNMQGYLQRHGKVGDPDLIAFVPVDKTMWVMFFEVKREDGKGVHSDNQKKFGLLWTEYTNVIYSIVTDAKQIKNHVKYARSHSTDNSCFDKLDEEIAKW